MAEPLLRIESFSYRYPGSGVSALDGVDLEVHDGEFVLLVGRSASGKSTLLRAANGLVPHFFGGALAGRTRVGGLDTRACGPAEISRVAASVFQEPESQVVMTSVAAELALPLENSGGSSLAVARATEETALAVGIEHLLERPVQTLSGGELQKVALGAALITRPRLLLLDEPTSQLDPVAADDLVWQLRSLNEQWGTTVVMIEQRLERCLEAADRVVVLEGGHVALDAPPARFVAWSATRAAELTPPVAKLFALADLAPLPVGVKEARASLRRRGFDDAEPDGSPSAQPAPRAGGRFFRRGRRRRGEAALSLERAWAEYDQLGGPAVPALRGLDLAVARGETIALLGRNGAGKSTLLRCIAGLQPLRRGRMDVAGEPALVPQTPADLFLHEHVADELDSSLAHAALEEIGLLELAERNPRDLSGSERQRLAIAIVLAGRGIGAGDPPAVIALDEPTRGMDRFHERRLAATLRGFALRGSAVLVATQDVEFAARVADRAVLLAAGRVIADGSTAEVLSGGRYFVTQVARVLGENAGITLAEEGGRWIKARLEAVPSVGAEDRDGSVGAIT